ncbi:MAG: HAD family hydrolase, partial [Propionibacteriaceae bacterium]|nr:HAD family hydrolase [Propionibacteriaceae bacterium]
MPERPALVALDIDGTLAGADGVVSSYSRRVVRRLVEAQVAGVIISGRPERSALAVARNLGLTAPVISFEGAMVTDPVTGDRLLVRTMEPDQARLALAAGRQFDLGLTLYGVEAWYAEAPDQSNRAIVEIMEQDPVWGPLDPVVDQVPLVKVMLGA